jgi:ATP-dependent helicase/nuclease subunit B
MIDVLIGPANSGKTETLTATIAAAVAAGRRGTHLIVPSEPSAHMLRELLSDKIGGLSLQGRHPVVTTFPAFYRAILDKSGVVYHWMNLIERERILRFVIVELAQSGSLRYFGEIAELPGLVNSLGEVIDELWRSRITPEGFARLAEERSDKDRDIARILTHYAATLDSLNAVDSESAGHAALSAVAKMQDLRRWFSLIAVDGFDFITATQSQLLSMMATRGVEVRVSLLYDEARAIHYWQRPTMARLRAAGASFTHYRIDPKTSIQVAAARLMSEPDTAEVWKNDLSEVTAREGEIRIISAPDRASEVRTVAREVKRLAIENHVGLDDIAIVCRSLSFYAHHIERIFAECMIPVVMDASLAVKANPAVIAFLKLLSLSGQSFLRRNCIEVWRSPYFDWSDFGLDAQAVDLLDAISFAKNITWGRAQWRRAVISAAEGAERESFRTEYDSHEDQSEADRLARYDRLAASLDHWFDALTPLARATREAHFDWVTGLMARTRFEERAASGENLSRDCNALKEFNSILAAITHDDIAPRFAVKTNEPAANAISWQALVSEIEGALAVVTYDRAVVAPPCVVAQEAHRLRPRRYRAVFALGLIEGEFPAKVTERAPFTLAERGELRHAGLDLTETIHDAGADLLQFYKTMSRAVERLYLIFARTDVAGGELLPSYLIEEVQPYAASPLQRIAPAFSGEDYDFENTCSLEELALRTARAQRNNELTVNGAGPSVGLVAKRLLDARLPSWQMTQRGAQIEWRRISAASGDNHRGSIMDEELREAIKQRFGPDHLWSASQINDYGICPFRFFARHTLKLEVAKEPGEGFTARHLGQAYHRILDRLYTRLQESDLLIQTPSAEQAIEQVASIAEEVLEHMLEKGEVRRDGLWEFNKEEIKRRVARLLRREAAWNDDEPARVVHCECKFGLEGVEPLVIDCAGGEAKFCGIVDRLDRRDNGDWVVVDYKTRRTPIPIKDALDGRNLQLPIYAMAASRVINRRESVASAYYLHIHSRKRGSPLSKDGEAATSLESLIQHAEERIRFYVEQIRSGRFPVQPNGEAVCQTCDYGVMCRIQSLRAFEDEQDRNE